LADLDLSKLPPSHLATQPQPGGDCGGDVVVV
jgi:hypothetical protein